MKMSERWKSNEHKQKLVRIYQEFDKHGAGSRNELGVRREVREDAFFTIFQLALPTEDFERFFGEDIHPERKIKKYDIAELERRRALLPAESGHRLNAAVMFAKFLCCTWDGVQTLKSLPVQINELRTVIEGLEASERQARINDWNAEASPGRNNWIEINIELERSKPTLDALMIVKEERAHPFTNQTRLSKPRIFAFQLFKAHYGQPTHKTGKNSSAYMTGLAAKLTNAAFRLNNDDALSANNVSQFRKRAEKKIAKRPEF